MAQQHTSARSSAQDPARRRTSTSGLFSRTTTTEHQLWGPDSGPQRFGRYILLDRLVAGGMAEVFRSVVIGPQEFQRVVVVKRILPRLCADPAFVKMFIDEATLRGRLSHPNIIQVHEFGEQEDQHFIAMEYVHGRGLAQVLRRLAEGRQPLRFTVAAEVMRQVCRGLAY